MEARETTMRRVTWQGTIILALCASVALGARGDDDPAVPGEETASRDGRCETPAAATDNDSLCDSLCRSADQVWLVSSRHLPYCTVACGDEASLEYQRYQGDCQWRASSQEDFSSTEDGLRTLIFVHGNRMSPAEAKQSGLAVYRALVSQAEDEEGVRFVIYSWPSTKIRGPLRDARLKADLSDPAGYYLAVLLNRMDPQTEIGLIGYSFGARAVSGALHLLSGGDLNGMKLCDSKADARKPMRVVMIVAAMDDDWFEPGRYHQRALTAVDQMVMFTNCCDPAMKRYQAVDRCGCPTALGYSGVASPGALGAQADKIEERDVSCLIGRTHHLECYLVNAPIMAQTWQFLAKGESGKAKGER